MSINNPLVSVILPCFNAENFIEVAVNSILNQSYTNIELIVIDDGSSDASLDILQQIKDARLTVISQQNVGYKVTLNRLLELTNGEFIARQDADDISLPLRFEKQVAFMLNNPNCAVVGTWAEIFCPTNKVKRFHKHPTDNLSLQFFLLFDNPFVHSSIMMRKTCINKVGVYDINKGWEDYDLWSRFSREYEIANLPEVLQVYRELNSGVSKTTKDYAARVNQISLENLLYYLPSEPNNVKDLCSLYHGKYQEISIDCTPQKIELTFNRIANEISKKNNFKNENLLNELQTKYLRALSKKIKRFKRFGNLFLFARALFNKLKK